MTRPACLLITMLAILVMNTGCSMQIAAELDSMSLVLCGACADAEEDRAAPPEEVDIALGAWSDPSVLDLPASAYEPCILAAGDSFGLLLVEYYLSMLGVEDEESWYAIAAGDGVYQDP